MYLTFTTDGNAAADSYFKELFMQNEDAIKNPMAATPVPCWIWSVSMMKGWTDSLGYPTPLEAFPAAPSMDALAGLIDHLCAAGIQLGNLLPPNGRDDLWTMKSAIDAVCVPFGEWGCRLSHESGHMVDEPVWRCWLQDRVTEILFPCITVRFACERQFIVPLVLTVTAPDELSAREAACRLLRQTMTAARPTGPSARFWVLDSASGHRDGGDRCVQLAVEMQACMLDDAYLEVKRMLDLAGARVDLGWVDGVPFGSVVASGTHNSASVDEACAWMSFTGPAHNGGVLPARWF